MLMRFVAFELFLFKFSSVWLYCHEIPISVYFERVLGQPFRRCFQSCKAWPGRPAAWTATCWSSDPVASERLFDFWSRSQLRNTESHTKVTEKAWNSTSENTLTDSHQTLRGWLGPGYLPDYAKLHYGPISGFCPCVNANLSTKCSVG